jgi:hypothetical protein
MGFRKALMSIVHARTRGGSHKTFHGFIVSTTNRFGMINCVDVPVLDGFARFAFSSGSFHCLHRRGHTCIRSRDASASEFSPHKKIL